MQNLDPSVIEAGKLFSEKKFEEAKAVLESYLKKGVDTEAYNLLAMTYFSTDGNSLAIDYLKKAIELEPQNINYLNNMAIAHLQTDLKTSQYYFEKSLKIDPKSFETNKKLAQIYINLGKIREALICYDTIIRTEKIDYDVALNYAKLLNDVGEYSQAIQYLNQALNFDENSTEVQYLAADIFYNMNMPVEATGHYKKFLSLQNTAMDSFIFSKIQKLWSDYSKRYYPYQKIKEKSYIEAYKKAIEENVENKVVFEYGFNGGLFALMAAKAGAKKVYICEKDQYIAGQLSELIKTNNYENIIEVIHKNLYQIADIKVDIAIVDRFGTNIVEQNILIDIQYINNTILKQDGKLLPKRATLQGMCINSDYFKKIDYGFDMRGFSIFDNSFSTLNINRIDFEQSSEIFKVFEQELSKVTTQSHTIITPKYIKEKSNAVCCWYELLFSQDNKVSTYTKDTNYFEQFIWNIDIDSEANIEVIYQNKDIFVEIINIEKKP